MDNKNLTPVGVSLKRVEHIHNTVCNDILREKFSCPCENQKQRFYMLSSTATKESAPWSLFQVKTTEECDSKVVAQYKLIQNEVKKFITLDKYQKRALKRSKLGNDI